MYYEIIKQSYRPLSITTESHVIDFQVLITAHIPPGIHTPNSINWMYTEFGARLTNILRRHSGIIVGMHFGHDHADGFKILPDVHGTCNLIIE